MVWFSLLCRPGTVHIYCGLYSLWSSFSYEFVKYLHQYVESSLGTVVEEETKSFTIDGQHAVGSGHDTLVHVVTQRTRDSAE